MLLLTTQMVAGAVNMISSEEEFDLVLRGHQQRLVVLEASLTWCRPCKGFDRAYQKFAGVRISASCDLWCHCTIEEICGMGMQS